MLVHNIYERDARVRRYAECLADEGHFVDIISLASETHGSAAGHPNIRVYPLPLTRVRRERLGQLVDWGVALILMFFRASWLDLRKRYDLIHTHNMPDFIVFCPLLARARGCPVLLDIHDPTPELARSKLSVSETHPVARVLAFLERISAAFSSHVITATPTFKRLLVRRGTSPEKITVIMNAADPRVFRRDAVPEKVRAPKAGFTLLYVGTVAPRYGLAMCVQALPRLRSEMAGIRLKIVPKIRNEGRGLEELLSLAARLGVSDLVQVADPVPLEMMPEIMREADIGVYPAVSDCHMDIAISLKIPEMVAVGLPIVASRLPVLEELYGADSIAFVPPGDHEAFAEKILELHRSPHLMQSLAENALLRSKTLTWESQSEKYRQLIESLVRAA
jgi:glycosyltransferase involved in cell wall biosynthesis